MKRWQISELHRPKTLIEPNHHGTPASLPAGQVSQAAADELLKRGLVEQGDWVILTKGDSYHTIGGTNGMKILHVGDPLV